jgi:hypothetical protein
MNSQTRKSILAKVKRTLSYRDKVDRIMTDVNVDDNVDVLEVTRDKDGYILDTDTLKFTVPQDTIKEDAVPGSKYDKQFTFRVVETEEQAQAIMKEKDLSLVDLINRKLKGDARSNAYQAETIAHTPVKLNVPASEVKERMIRDFMRLGLQESVARAQVESILAANNG